MEHDDGTARWSTVDVGGSAVEYLECGTGDPLLFLHGWGITPRTYSAAISGLTSAGVRVLAPSLPGFGRSRELPGGEVSMPAYAAWAASFLDAVGVDVPAFVMGHSLGGGVALQLAHDRPELVRSLTLLNSVGGSPPATDRDSRRVGLTSRPWWRWALAVAVEADPRDVRSLRPRAVGRLAASIAHDVVPNAVRRPTSMARSALLALTTCLVDEAQRVVAAGLPVLFVWGDRDRLITPGAFASVEWSLPPEVVPGRHGWLLTSPDAFGRVLREALVVHATLERSGRRPAPDAAALREHPAP